MSSNGPSFSAPIPWPKSLSSKARAVLSRQFIGRDGEGEFFGGRALDIEIPTTDVDGDMERLVVVMNALVDLEFVCGTRMSPCLLREEIDGKKRVSLVMRVMAAPGMVETCRNALRRVSMLWECPA